MKRAGEYVFYRKKEGPRRGTQVRVLRGSTQPEQEGRTKGSFVVLQYRIKLHSKPHHANNRASAAPSHDRGTRPSQRIAHERGYRVKKEATITVSAV